MAQIVVADIEAYDPSISGTRTLRFATQSYVTGGRNLLTWSEDATQGWTATFGMAITANAAQAPDGSMTADKIQNTAGAVSLLQRSVTVAASASQDYYASLFVKRGNSSGFTLNVYYSGNAENDVSFNFDTGAVSGAPYPGEVVFQALPDGWYRCGFRIARDATGTRTSIMYRLWESVRASGVVGNNLTIWGVQLEPCNRIGSYTPTRDAAISEFHFYEGRIEQPANVKRDCFSDGRTTGRSQIGFGDMVLINNDGGLDYMLDYSFAGRPVTIRLGTVMPYSNGIPTWTTILVGAMEQVELSWQKVTVRVRDRQLDLAQPLQQTRYAGNNSLPAGLEGNDDDLKGRPKPLVYGKVFNIAPPQVNTSRLIYQIHTGGQVVSVDAVYDRGAVMTAGAAYTSQSDMETNAPTAGQYRVWNDATLGCFVRVGSNPTGTLTADVTQGSSRTVGQLFKAILLKAGVASANINQADITALDTAVSYEAGVFAGFDRDYTALELLDELCNSVGAWYGPDVNGVFRIGRIVLPTGDAVGTITALEVIKIERIASRDPGVGVPAWKVKVGYQKIHSVQVDLSSSVTATRKTFVAEKYRRTEASDSSVKTANLLSPEIEFNTVLANKTDAGNEAERRLLIYKARRDVFQLTVRVDAALASVLDLGKIVTLQLNRFGMSAGKKFIIIGIRTNMRGYQFDLTLWG